MTVVSLCNSKIECITLFYYIAHVFGLISAVGLTVTAICMGKAEWDALGDFEPAITHSIRLAVYTSSGLLVLTVAIGYLAQRRPEKSSLWILYCILLLIVSLWVFTTSVSSFSKARNPSTYSKLLKSSMEDYADNHSSAWKWDKLQNRFKCCGTHSYQDWQDVNYGRISLRVPPSCCLPERREETLCGLNILPESEDAKTKIYDQGCQVSALANTFQMMAILGGLGFFVAATHAFLTVFSYYVVVSKKV